MSNKYELEYYGKCDSGLNEEIAKLMQRRSLRLIPDALAAQERNSLIEITARILKK